MAPNGGNRAREWVWSQPGRARAALAGAAVLALAAGAFVAIRPGGDDASGRDRHRQYAGSTATDGQAPEELGAPGGSTAPDGAGGTTATEASSGSKGPRPSPAGAPATAGAPGTTAAAPGGGSAGSPTSTGGSTGSQPGTATTPTSGPTATTRKGVPVTAGAAAGWAALPRAPIAGRSSHTAVWTGREMVVWGGMDDNYDPLGDGAAYDPAARTWRKIPAAPLPPRYGDTAYWTGQEMIIFGGAADGEPTADGAAWNPATNTWRPIPASPLGPRDGAVVAWAGDRLVVWSGFPASPTETGADDAVDDPPLEAKNDGAAYVPASNSWVPVGPAPIPPRGSAQFAWTGSRLIVSGGDDDADGHTDGAALDPVSGAWSPIAARPEPGTCGGDTACTGLWTGRTVLFPASGLAYDPAADRWSSIAGPRPDTPAPGEPAVWGNGRLLTFGTPAGSDDDAGDTVEADTGPAKNAAGAYDPAANRWQPVPAGPLSGRSMHTAVWTGDALLVWGGVGTDDELAQGDGAAYRP